MGTLYIVSTPIGNLGDITFRAIETLKSVDYILAEDTRVTGKLLKYYSISPRMISLNDFNEQSRLAKVISDLKMGKKIALVSDAGTPLISDPGYKLVREAVRAGIRIESIPGPSAVISALTVSGLPPDKFLFLGYLPKKANKRKEMLRTLGFSNRSIKPTVIIYESPHRITETLTDIKAIFGDVDIVVCRELTKLYEEVMRGKVSEIISRCQSKIVRGELVILF